MTGWMTYKEMLRHWVTAEYRAPTFSSWKQPAPTAVLLSHVFHPTPKISLKVCLISPITLVGFLLWRALKIDSQCAPTPNQHPMRTSHNPSFWKEPSHRSAQKPVVASHWKGYVSIVFKCCIAFPSPQVSQSNFTNIKQAKHVHYVKFKR